EGGDPLLQLLDRRLSARRPATAPAQLGVNVAVRQAGAVVVGRHERVQLAAQQEPPLRRAPRARRLLLLLLLLLFCRSRFRGALPPLGGHLLGLSLAEEHGDLLSGEQARQPQVLLFLRRPRPRAGAERLPVE